MRLGVGMGILAWGFIGLQVSNHAEAKLKATEGEADQAAALERPAPKVIVADDGTEKSNRS
jgi:hypothetical protein